MTVQSRQPEAGSPDGLERRDREGVAWLRLDRPKAKNALDTALLRALRVHLQSIGDDPRVRAVVVTGAGDAFCAGADLREFSSDSPAGSSLARLRLVVEVLTRIRTLEQPTIAAVGGAAVGAGWGLALACDLCFAVDDAVFWLPEIAKGFRLPAVVMRRLIEIVGPVRAAEIALGGERHDTRRALAWGWVTRSFSDRAALDEATAQFATDLASRPRRSLAGAIGPLRYDGRAEPSPPAEFAWNEEH
jgi:2-(1,2-epoxy-1,2-dihydrophenyl)acetyl-CoA isomerase